MNAGSDWSSSRALLTLKPSRRRWTLNSTWTIQRTARNCAEQFWILWPGEKFESKKGMVEILSFSVWQAFCSAIHSPRNFRCLLLWRKKIPRRWMRCPRLIPRARGLVLQPLATEAKDLPPRNRNHQPLPLAQTPAKAQLAGCVETQPSVYLATFPPFCVLGVPIMHEMKMCDARRSCSAFIAVTSVSTSSYRRGEPFQCVLKACEAIMFSRT